MPLAWVGVMTPPEYQLMIPIVRHHHCRQSVVEGQSVMEGRRRLSLVRLNAVIVAVNITGYSLI